mgnify:CR=1 FL=1
MSNCPKCDNSLTAGTLYAFSEQKKFVSSVDSTTSIFVYINHVIPEDDPEYGTSVNVLACSCGYNMETDS